jgi:hypothetical protein
MFEFLSYQLQKSRTKYFGMDVIPMQQVWYQHTHLLQPIHPLEDLDTVGILRKRFFQVTGIANICVDC